MAQDGAYRGPQRQVFVAGVVYRGPQRQVFVAGVVWRNPGTPFRPGFAPRRGAAKLSIGPQIAFMRLPWTSSSLGTRSKRR